MDPEDKKLLEQTYSLGKENNRMLHAMRRSMFWAHVTRVTYWLIIIGVSIGVFYYTQPYLDQLMKMYGTINSAFKNLPK